MALTRAQVETILVKRCGAMMSVAAMSVLTTGSNADLNDPIGYALRKSGFSVADPTSVSTADLAAVSNDDLDQVLDIAEYRTLESILSAVNQFVDTSTGPYRQSLSQYADTLEKRITRLKTQIDNEYGTLGEVEIGSIQLDFADHNDTLIETE